MRKKHKKSFIRKIRGYLSKERFHMGKSNKEFKPDISFKLKLCEQHKDYVSKNGNIKVGDVVLIFRLLLECPHCKVVIEK